jgi:hypothetical protein
MTWKGVPVNHYQACQTWPGPRAATVLVDYYFKVRDFQSAVEISSMDEQYKETPFAFVVEGFTDQDRQSIYREYNFFEFKNIIERTDDLLNVYEELRLLIPLREGAICRLLIFLVFFLQS